MIILNMKCLLIETILKKYGFNLAEQGKNKILLEKNES
jgi:hypothetical protein